MAKRRTLNDPVFGKITAGEGGGSWDATVKTAVLGTKVPVTILAPMGDDDAAPSDQQRAAFSSFLKRERAVVDAAAKLIFQLYVQCKDHWLQPGFLSHEDPVPKHPSEIWLLATDPSMAVTAGDDDPADEGEPQIEIGWQCPWDPEHGVNVVVRGTKVEFTS